jgi:hypothetical protein
MARWSRPIGVALSLALVAALVAIGLRSEGPEPPDADPHNGLVYIQDNLWSTASHQYAVWVGTDGTPYAGSRDRGSGRWQSTNLARIPGNPLAAPTADDLHNVYAIAVDAKGGVHIAGNMHDSPLRYVRSTPGSLDSWAKRPAPAATGSITYPAFTALPDGTLLFWRRDGRAGEGEVLLDALEPGSRAWRQLGVVLDGAPSEESPYLHHIAIDSRSGVIHLLFEWRGGAGAESNNDVGYARSADAGRTWETSDGAPLELPITHAAAETVIDTPPNGSGLLNQGGLTVDASGRPHGVVTFEQPDDSQLFEHVWLDEGEWQREQLTDIDLEGRPQLAGTPDGRVWLLGVRGDVVEAIDVTPDAEHAPDRELAQVPLGWEVNYDSQALARFGTVEMLIPEGDRPHVVEASLVDD